MFSFFRSQSATASIITVALWALCVGVAQGQEDPPAERPTLAAVRLEAAPLVDGEVLTDRAWSAARTAGTYASGFLQMTPNEGESASEDTEVYVAFDDHTLYIGVVCHDREPADMVIADSRRDASLDDTDSFQLILDTFDDQRSAFVFGTNPAGIQYDGQVTADATGENGGIGSFNLDWDGAWEVATKVFGDGWSAEMAIPFSTVRYPAGGPQTWGMNFQRNIRRHREKAFWAPVPRNFDVRRVSLAGSLTGMEPPHRPFLHFTPYVLGAGERGRDGLPDTEEDAEVGFDIKYGLSAGMALDLTYNTDFAQVEADVQQINFDRFNLFFPEKRPFFLENAGLFRVGVPAEIELFFSRRIGIGPGGEAIPIDGGVRLSGKSGRTNVGLLYMQTDDVSSGLGGPAVNEYADAEFAVVRVSQDIGERSSIGLIATSRQGDGPGRFGDDNYGRTYGVDGRLALGTQGELTAFAATTDTPGEIRDEHAYRVGGLWNTRTTTSTLNYTEVGEGFNPEVGFVSRRGYRKADGFILKRHRPKEFLKLHELRPHIFFRSFWDFDGVQETGYIHVDNHSEWKNGVELHTGINFTRERVKEPFQIAPGVTVPVGLYDHELWQFGVFSNKAKAVSYRLTGLAGGFFGGDRLTLTPGLVFRRGEKLNGEVVWSHTEVDLPDGSFETDLARLRLSYAFTPRLFIDSLVQYNDRLDQWSSNLRLGWRDNANSGLYVVYNDIEDLDNGAFEPQRRLIIKYSRRFEWLDR